jgi:hypothetical protein
MNEDQLLHYDPLKIENIFLSTLMHYFFAKQSPMSWNAAWKQAIANNYWVWPNRAQQDSNLKCEFYVMRFITNYYEWKSANQFDNIQVCVCLKS